MINGLILVFVTFCRVGLLAFQTLNVVHGRYMGALITSIGLAFVDVGLILVTVHIGWWAVPFVAVGGSAGVLCAMKFHPGKR